LLNHLFCTEDKTGKDLTQMRRVGFEDSNEAFVPLDKT